MRADHPPRTPACAHEHDIVFRSPLGSQKYATTSDTLLTGQAELYSVLQGVTNVEGLIVPRGALWLPIKQPATCRHRGAPKQTEREDPGIGLEETRERIRVGNSQAHLCALVQN